MSFDELQSIWDSQKISESVLDQETMLTNIKARDRDFSRLVNITDTLMILCLLFVAVMFMRDPVLQGHDRVLLIPGVACLIAAGFVWKCRIDRKKRQMTFDDSLLGLIEKSIDAIQDRISRMGTFLWWFACPNLVGLGIALLIVADSKRYLLYSIFIPAFLLCMGFAYWQVRREIRRVLLPEKARLEALRSQLLNSE